MENVGIKTDVKQLLRVLGPSMYKGDTFSVAVKELYQNAFDACKKQVDGEINFQVSSEENFVQCRDNGIGMSSQTIREVYLTIGGTLKDNLDVSERSGGLGLAKVQFLMSCSKIKVESYKDGEHSILEASQEELFDGVGKLTSEPCDASIHGTTVTLWYPHTVTRIDGSEIQIDFGYGVPWILQVPTPGYNVLVTFDRVDYRPAQHTIIKQTAETLGDGWERSDSEDAQILSVNFNGRYFDADVRIRLDKEKSWCCSSYVFSAGLYQFKHSFHRSGKYFGFPMYMSVKPRVAAGMEGYPFNNQREGFRQCASEDLEVLGKMLFDVQDVIVSERIRKEFEEMATLDYFAVDATTDGREKRNPLKLNPKFVEKMGDVMKTVSLDYETPAFVRETKIEMTKAEEAAAKSTHLKVKNDTTGSYRTGKEVFSKIASVILDALDKCPDEMKQNPKWPTVVGILIDKKAHGCLVSGMTNGLFINPLSSPVTTCEGFVEHVYMTFLHEVTHVYYGGHYDEFCSKMHELAVIFHMEGIDHFVRDRTRTIALEHCIVIDDLVHEFALSSKKK